MKKQKGFTFVELLAVIVILGLLITFATIAISSLKKKQDEKNYLNEISTIFTGAKAYMTDHPERLSFGVDGDNPYKCSGIYSVYGTRYSDNVFSIIKGTSGKNDLYLYLNEKIYKLEGEYFEEITKKRGSAEATWDDVGEDYDQSTYYNIFLGWYDWSVDYTSWNRNWKAVDSEGNVVFENENLFKEIIKDNNEKVACATSANDIGISYKRLDELGYISIEPNSQIYNYLYKTNKLYKKGNLDDKVNQFFENMGDNINFTTYGYDSHTIGLYRCSTYDQTGNETLNLVYEIYKFDILENKEKNRTNYVNKIYTKEEDRAYNKYIIEHTNDKYFLTDFSIYNDCGCNEQEGETSEKLCYAGESADGSHCTYWSGGQYYNNWMLSPPDKVYPYGKCEKYK